MGKIQIVKARTWYSRTDNFLPLSYDIGMRVTNAADKPTIDLFSIDANHDAGSVHDSAYTLCQHIIDDHFPDRKVTDFNWTYSESAARTNIIFSEQHGQITGIKLDNAMAGRYGFHTKLENYERALQTDDPIKFLSDGHPERYKGGQIERVIVPLPLHPAKAILMEPDLHGDQHRIVLADPAKTLDLMIRDAYHQTGLKTLKQLERYYNAQPMKGDDTAFPPFHTSVQEAIDNIKPQLGYPRDMGRAAYFKPDPDYLNEASAETSGLGGWLKIKLGQAFKPPAPESLEFVNGRHRTLNLIKLGAPYVPLLMHKADPTDAFEAAYGWRGGKMQLL